MAGYAVMPQTDYENACAAAREKTNTTGTIKSGELAAKIRSIAGGASFKSDYIYILTYSQKGGTLSTINQYVTLRVPLPSEVSNSKFVIVSVCGFIYDSDGNPIGTYGGSGVMDNQDGTNPGHLFTGVFNYSYDRDGTIRAIQTDGEDYAFYNPELNCFEFQIGDRGDSSHIADTKGDLYYWYF